MSEKNKELLELAAKAAGIRGEWSDHYEAVHVNTAPLRNFVLWNPLTNRDDLFNLMVGLRLRVEVNDESTLVSCNISEWEAMTPVYEYPDMDQDGNFTDQVEATVLAIVRAAAELGKLMP